MAMEPKKCKWCAQWFNPKAKNQILCQEPCSLRTKKTIAELNNSWALRDEDFYLKRKKISKNNFNQGRLRVI